MGWRESGEDVFRGLQAYRIGSNIKFLQTAARISAKRRRGGETGEDARGGHGRRGILGLTEGGGKLCPFDERYGLNVSLSSCSAKDPDRRV